MAINLKPIRRDLPPVKKGDTYPATSYAFAFSVAKPDLLRVRVKFKAYGSDTSALTLDSDDTGITITDASAWEFTVDEISTVSLTAGYYGYDLETTDAGGVRTYLEGDWRILPEITD